MNLEKYTDEFERALIMTDKEKAHKIIIDASKNAKPFEIATVLITEVLQRIGNAWEKGIISLSQVYLSGIFCEEMIEEIFPKADPERMNQPTMAIGVFEDYHLLGKRIIYSSLRASGFELYDLGGGLKSEDIIKVVKEKKIKILLLSVLMLPSALRIKDLKSELQKLNVKLIVGGAPFLFDDELWKEVGADSMGRNAADAIRIVNEMIGEAK